MWGEKKGEDRWRSGEVVRQMKAAPKEEGKEKAVEGFGREEEGGANKANFYARHSC